MSKTLNPLRRALAEATESQVAEMLQPFEVKSFAELHRKYQDLRTYKKVHMQEEEKKAKEAIVEQDRTEANKLLNKAGITVNEAIVDAYLKLSEEKRGEFVQALLPKPVSTLRAGQADIGTEKKLDEKAKAELVSKMPFPTV